MVCKSVTLTAGYCDVRQLARKSENENVAVFSLT